jgi:hypothetical protein
MTNYGLDVDQLRELVIVPTLKSLNLHTKAAENLVLGTALVESRARYIKQLGTGPALGIFQMEPATHDDIWDNYLSYRTDLANQIKELVRVTEAGEMIGNLYYAAAMCRVHYRRVRSPLPEAGNALDMACYWKNHYNTALGAGTVSKAQPHFVVVCS